MNLRPIAQRIFEDLISGGDLSQVDALISPDYVDARGPRGQEGFAQGLVFIREAFPDWQSTIDEMIVEGNTVAARWTVRGTHRGTFMGIPATGRAIIMQECGFLTFREGRLQSIRRVADELSMLRQLGLLPEGM